MPPLLLKTFGGLSRSYYVRQLIFAAAMATVLAFMFSQGKGSGATPGFYALLVINTLLYPYSRFVYESVVGFIVGDNLFFVNALLMLFVKVMTMTLCWSMAIFIAPLGLAYLYWHHSRQPYNS
ncbi:MAG: hypothetical protein PGN19_04640 [Pseudomonas oryzihabitans]